MARPSKRQKSKREYEKTLCLLLSYAAHKLLPGTRVNIQHAYGRGLYGYISSDPPVGLKELTRLKREMIRLVRDRVPIVPEVMPRNEAIQVFETRGATDRVRLLKHLRVRNVTLHRIRDYLDYFIGSLLTNAGDLSCFDLIPYDPGFVLMPFDPSDCANPLLLEEHKQLFDVFHESRQWASILGVEDVGALNEAITSGNFGEFIKIAEALHEKRIAAIADDITEAQDKIKLVFIAGPSSSGKTTFSKRLRVQLRVNGLNPVLISLDDYFLSRSIAPGDPSDVYKYETIDVIDLPLLNLHLDALMNGEEIEVPKFNFGTGMRKRSTRPIRLTKDQIVIVEGLHGLNPAIAPNVPSPRKFKIYVSALTQLNLDSNNRIPTSDTRLIRRLVRDALFRNHNAEETLSRWPAVRSGEQDNIFAYQDDVDAMFNSALVYEPSVLQRFAMPLLKEVRADSPVTWEAKRLRTFLHHFRPVKAAEVPPTSILREFIGESSFQY
jgi:uridine kinase